MTEKQVDSSHYDFSAYLDKPRWASLWHQVDLLISEKPKNVLEIGPGPGVLKAVVQAMGVPIKTLDPDPDLRPDYVGSVVEIPLESESFDVVCAFQVLEHLPFEVAIQALIEMTRVARRSVIISLPDARRYFRYVVHVPFRGEITTLIPRPRWRPQPHEFDGQHYWEINKRGYELQIILGRLLEHGSLKLVKTFLVPEKHYHRFFSFDKISHGGI